MSKTKPELQEELKLVKAELAMVNAELESVKAQMKKTIESQKAKAQRHSDKLKEDLKKVYDDAQEVYTQAISTAREVYKGYELQAEDQLGIPAKAVREQVMYSLKQIFGDEL